MNHQQQFISYDNSNPPQLWVFEGPQNETAEPLRRVREPEATRIAELMRENEKLRTKVAELDRKRPWFTAGDDE